MLFLRESVVTVLVLLGGIVFVAHVHIFGYRLSTRQLLAYTTAMAVSLGLLSALLRS